ncbi:MAG: 5-methyltetrahydropteroyltriglutamate--homocysteine S-methyltransferase [Holosporales bacterium]|jgi:5-methyltetrahydropteroyltriglutamate--homocysteine methyltransferase|nr:5-methyltetrahydropteroyltriglutamate--homocysteine S-methyltransferase [Thalassospira sp.]
MVVAANLGFPRIGLKRELKKALESFWYGETTEAQLQETAKSLRAGNWKLQAAKGIDHIPSNDFTLYDQTLDTTAMVGAIPARYNWKGDTVDTTTYFAMARGRQKDGVDVPAMEMTKWFDTNYHYIVPEFEAGQTFKLASTKIVDQYNEAKALGITTRPVLLGPVSYLILGKAREGVNKFDLLAGLLPVYQQIIDKLAAAGVQWVQLDEPCLATDLSAAEKAAFQSAYKQLNFGSIKTVLTAYFDGYRDNLELALSLPTTGIHFDLVRAPEQLSAVLALPAGKIASLGLIDGRNVWRSSLSKKLEVVKEVVAKLGADRVIVAGSCSLQHSPIDLSEENKLDAELKGWMAYAVQKLEEIAALKAAASGNADATVKAFFEANDKAAASRLTSPRIHNPAVKDRVAKITAKDSQRTPFASRQKLQQAALGLPLYPTTTIGSFPQTQEVREARAAWKRGELTEAKYEEFLEKKIQETVQYQEEIGIDVPVHGEFERNDMVEYFGEQLQGYAFSKNGWVQSYGSRYVKPPIIFGDVSRPEPMTVRWSKYAQSLTKKPMKGMLTGPVTMLQWSFVRDDQPRETTTKQIALAIRDEVVDLEKAGITIIQIDEPAFREGLPLRKAEWANYLRWAVETFRISAAGVADTTQIHTHMCYSEFNDIMPSIGDMDADVISIETARSQMELLEAFINYKYPAEIGPGVYDIHSPRQPGAEEMANLLRKAVKRLDPSQVWVNPDCGLKTRKWNEVKPALSAMVNAAKIMRSESPESKVA